MKRAVAVGLSGGLGNQMFQYAAGRALSARLNVPLILDLSLLRSLKSRSYALAPFAISATPWSAEEFFPSVVQSIWSRIARRYATRRMGLPVFRERQFHFDPAILKINKPVYLDGYWQSEKNFPNKRDLLLQELRLRERLPENCEKLQKKISIHDSICVHVRRGDYVTDPSTAKIHGICSMDYYHRAIRHISAGLSNPHIFLFSDDPDFVRGNFKADVPATIVDKHASSQVQFDFTLMCQCNHFVIANSSFSWWAAWLGQFPSKRVAAPLQWFQTSKHDTRDLIPHTWSRF